MITCEFKTNSEAQSKELMDSIWESVKHWLDYDSKAIVLCQWCNKDGEHVALYIDDNAGVSISLIYETSEKSLENLVLVLMHGEDLRRITIPADVAAKVFHDEADSNTSIEESARNEFLKEFVGTQNIIDKVLEDYKCISSNEGYITGLSTGYYDLDYKTRGFQKGQLTLLSGRKGVGKTNFALNIAHHAIKNEIEAVAIFSLELSGDQIARRLMELDMNQPLERVFYAQDKDAAKETLEKSANMLKRFLLYIDEDQDITTKKILDKCLALKEKNGLDLVIIDGRLTSMDNTEYKYFVLKRLKDIAKQIDCPILVISDISSEEEKAWNTCSETNEIPDWDYYNRVTDVKMLMQKTSLNSHGENDENEVEIVVSSHRDGRLGKVRLSVEPDIIKFKNLSGR